MLPKLPKDILLKIVGLAHLIWVKDKIIIEKYVYERTDLAHDVWDSCERLAKQLFKKRLKLQDMRLSDLEKNLFEKMLKNCAIKVFNPEDFMYKALIQSQKIDVSGNYTDTNIYVFFELEDQHGTSWYWRYSNKCLISIRNETETWFRRYERSWGGDIETTVLRFYNGLETGLFIYSEFPQDYKYIVGVDIANNLKQNIDFTTLPLTNVLLK